MRHGGRELTRYTGTVVIVRGEGEQLEAIQIKVQQLPVSWQEECERVLPPPTPPVIGKEKKPDGSFGPKYDTEDEKYRAEYATWQHRTWAKKIVDATIDKDVEFETDQGLLATDPLAYYDAIFVELSEAFSRGEIQRWLLTINSIDQVGGADVALVEEGLFPAVKRLLEVRRVEENEAEG